MRLTTRPSALQRSFGWSSRTKPDQPGQSRQRRGRKVRISLRNIGAKAKTNPDYAAALLAAGRPDGQWILIDLHSLRLIVAKHDPGRLPELSGGECSPALEPGLPSAWAMLKNASKSGLRIARQIAGGRGVIVSDEVKAARLAACHACEHFRRHDARCSLCGCLCSGVILEKVKYSTESCPASPPRWTALACS